MKLLLYCTKAKPNLKDYREAFMGFGIANHYVGETMNGKIVAECDFEVEEIKYEYEWKGYEDVSYFTNNLSREELEKKSCLENKELRNYLRLKPLCCVKGKNGYAIHIKNLHIFNEPRELFNYETQEIWNNTSHYHRTIMKAPQNMMYCYGKNTGEKYILISIRPEWLVKILNGEKQIEVRKKVLKEMI